MFFYTYYSYEPFGRGYIGRRETTIEPEKDEYLGSFTDETFKPSEKIVISLHGSREEAAKAEVELHEFYQVDTNPHFANRAKQTSSKFSFCSQGERRGDGNPTYGKVRIHNGSEERVVDTDKIPEGWQRGRIKNPKHYATPKALNRGRKFGMMYEKFLEDVGRDESILSQPIRQLSKEYQTSHTSIVRWKKSIVRSS